MSPATAAVPSQSDSKNSKKKRGKGESSTPAAPASIPEPAETGSNSTSGQDFAFLRELQKYEIYTRPFKAKLHRLIRLT